MKYNWMTLVLLFFILTAYAQSSNVGIFEKAQDMGNPKLAGLTKYDPSTQEYNLRGGGYNIWFQRDEFQYAYKKMKGDFILTAHVELIGKGTDPHRKVGWMVRESTEPDAAHISATYHGDGLTVLQWRELRGAYMRDPEDQIAYLKKKLQVIQLERKGKTYTMRVANWGEPLQVVGSKEMTNIKDEVLVGLFICSHNADVMEEAKAWNVRIDQPIPTTFNPYQEATLGCRLEIINPFDGKRKVIHQANDRFEAPNWMPDGKKLLINMKGSLYKIPIEGGELEKLNTDFANRNNNDHGISFDGKMLAISHHRDGQPGGGSTVYVLPLTGGTPKQVTANSPSYWHGWSPDGKDVVYTAQRPGIEAYNVYKASVADGKETQLTFYEKGLADGPEYSRDGKYVYYNGTESGTMQLWRVKPDGTSKEQITFDENNNWFAHASPDGKWVAYLAYPANMDPLTHPFCKQVEIKLMPASGGAARTIAYLYGGQGTINVPSWSPDSKYLAFVSNSGTGKE
jgi:Tol biopolymer transport system component